jgi:hypothetical protein
VTRLSAADRAHREAFWAYVLDQAEPWHRKHLARLFAAWDEANAKWYDGVLVPPILLLAEPSAPQVYGQCSTVSSYGARSEIRIRPSLLAGTHPHLRRAGEGADRFAADVLLHEQVHQHQQEVLGVDEEAYHGHGPTFRDKANEIGAALGLAPVRTSKRRGPDRDLPSCAQWPHCVRPADHYRGAWVPASRDRLSEEAVAHRLAAKYGARVLRRALELAEAAVDPREEP